jgi:hypothetical protein
MPALPAPSPPDPARLQQERTGLSERQNSARTRASHAGLATRFAPTGLYGWHSIGTAFCGYATNEVETEMQACSHAAAM